MVKAFEKTEAVVRFREGRSELFAALEDLSEKELTDIAVVGDWTVRDVLAHILAWEEVAVQRLELVAAGRASEIRWVRDEEVDDTNARFHRESLGLSLPQVRERLEKIGRQLEERLKRLPAGIAEGTELIAVWFSNCTYAHYQEHLEQITAWRRELETTET
jgi:uncharacterized damage-inducible protein DinB